MQVDIQHGRVKACCKTSFQTITNTQLEEFGTSVIFNNQYFQDRRREMFVGIKHGDCSSCWTQEKLGLLSYRLSQSASDTFRASLSAIAAEKRVDAIIPKHIEIILNTNCDLKCCYCGPEFSSSWAVEIGKQGAFPLYFEDQQIPANAPLFQQRFWQWFEQSQDSIEYIQFNGGEPLIQNEFYDCIEQVLKRNRKSSKLEIGIISNLNTPSSKMNRLCEVLPRIMEQCEFRFGISQDSTGARAEYIRNGLKWDRFDNNLRTLIKEFSGLSIQIAPTMSALNVTSVLQLLVYLNILSEALNKEIIIRPSIVMWPAFQSPLILPIGYSEYLYEAIKFLDKIGRWPEMAERLREIIEATPKVKNVDKLRKDFYIWFQEYDRRRNLSFLSVFPEMEGFWSYSARL
jgi:hypothetical protein